MAELFMSQVFPLQVPRINGTHKDTYVAGQICDFHGMECPFVHANSLIVASHVILVVFFIFVLHKNMVLSTNSLFLA